MVYCPVYSNNIDDNNNNKINLRTFYYTAWINQINVLKMNTVYAKE
jgi:hypothetical protein